jgi:hypothetical protein
MFKTLGSTCSTCHNGTSQAKPPTINIDKADMRSGACSSCHSSGDSDRGRGGRAPALFISAMKNSTVTYERCSDCHTIGNDGGSDGGGWGGGSGGGGSWGGGGGGSWGGGGGR